jgi:hypothetical protein
MHNTSRTEVGLISRKWTSKWNLGDTTHLNDIYVSIAFNDILVILITLCDIHMSLDHLNDIIVPVVDVNGICMSILVCQMTF